MATLAPDRAAARERFTRRLQMLSLTNQARELHDRADVRLNWLLSRYARRHSLEMASKGYLYHSEADTLVRVLSRYDFAIGGENVGVGTTVDGLQDAFMASPPHRENILRTAFDHVAIGMARVDGHLWVTVLFYG
jgi:uncharacterized protein YkwD